MKKSLAAWCLLFGVGAIGSFANIAFARSHVGQGTLISGQLFGRIGLCWTAPTDTTSTSYGVVLALEPGNGNEIAADIYSLDSNRRKVKQVGHADVTASSSSGVFTFGGAADSPFQFSLSLTPQDYSSGRARDHGSMPGTLTSAALFNGDTAANVTLQCDVANLNLLPEPTQSGSPSPTPSASATLSPTPQPSATISPQPAVSPSAGPTGVSD